MQALHALKDYALAVCLEFTSISILVINDREFIMLTSELADEVMEAGPGRKIWVWSRW